MKPQQGVVRVLSGQCIDLLARATLMRHQRVISVDILDLLELGKIIRNRDDLYWFGFSFQHDVTDWPHPYFRAVFGDFFTHAYARSELLVSGFKSRGDINCVAVCRISEASRSTDVSDYCRSRVRADARDTHFYAVRPLLFTERLTEFVPVAGAAYSAFSVIGL